MSLRRRASCPAVAHTPDFETDSAPLDNLIDALGLRRMCALAPQQGAGRDGDGCKVPADSGPAGHMASAIYDSLLIIL